MTPRRPPICPICGEPGDGVSWCDKCNAEIGGADSHNDRSIAEWAAKRGRNFERLRNRKRGQKTEQV
jgi:uncharacterized membrane protein YvbJ